MSGFTYPTLSTTVPLYNFLIDHTEDTIDNKKNKDEIDEIDQMDETDEIDQIDETDEIDQINETDEVNENTILKKAAEKCKIKLLKYYNKTNSAYLIATILDPRLKLQYYEDHKWGKELIESIKNKLVYFLIFFKFFLNYIIY